MIRSGDSIDGKCHRNGAYSSIITPTDNSDPVGHFLASVNELFEYTLQDVSDSDMVGVTIQN